MTCIRLTHLLLLSPAIITYSHWKPVFTRIYSIFLSFLLFTAVSRSLPPSHLVVLCCLAASRLHVFPFCTVSLCSPHKTSSVLHPRLSICATHLCCFAAVTEAHILIAARWARSHACKTCLGTHTHTSTVGYCWPVVHVNGIFLLTALSLGSCVFPCLFCLSFLGAWPRCCYFQVLNAVFSSR